MAGQGTAGIREVRTLPALFDRERLGLDVEVGIWYFASQVVTSLTWMIVPLVQGYGVGWSPWPYYVVMLVLNAAEAAALVAVFHAVQDLLPLAAAWGGVAVAVGVAFRGAIGMLAFEGWTMGPLLDPLALGSGFASGALFVLGLGVAVRRLGAVPSAFLGGAAAASAVHSVLYQLAWTITHEGGGFSWPDPVMSAVNGAIVGGLTYVGLARHVKRRGVGALSPTERPAASQGAPGGAAGAARSATAAATPAPPVPSASSTAAPAAVVRQHYFVCSGNASPIAAFMEACRVARAAGWGEYRELRAAVSGDRFEAAERRAKGADSPFPGTEHMGEQSWPTTGLEKVLAQIRAAESGGSVHVAHGATDSRRAEWMLTVYRRIVGEMLKQGVLPFRMYVTESDEAAAALVAALEEA